MISLNSHSCWDKMSCSLLYGGTCCEQGDQVYKEGYKEVELRSGWAVVTFDLYCLSTLATPTSRRV